MASSNFLFQDLCHISEVVARETVVRDKMPGGRYLQALLLSDINRYVYEIKILNLYMQTSFAGSTQLFITCNTEQLGGTLQMRLVMSI